MHSSSFRIFLTPDLLRDPNGRMKLLSDYGERLGANIALSSSLSNLCGYAMNQGREGAAYEGEDDLECAVVHYLRFLRVCRDFIGNHQDYERLKPEVKTGLRAKVTETRAKVEQLQKHLLTVYQSDAEAYLNDDRRRAQLAEYYAEAERSREEQDRRALEEFLYIPPPDYPPLTMPEIRKESVIPLGRVSSSAVTTRSVSPVATTSSAKSVCKTALPKMSSSNSAAGICYTTTFRPSACGTGIESSRSVSTCSSINNSMPLKSSEFPSPSKSVSNNGRSDSPFDVVESGVQNPTFFALRDQRSAPSTNPSVNGSKNFDDFTSLKQSESLATAGPFSNTRHESPLRMAGSGLQNPTYLALRDQRFGASARTSGLGGGNAGDFYQSVLQPYFCREGPAPGSENVPSRSAGPATTPIAQSAASSSARSTSNNTDQVVPSEGAASASGGSGRRPELPSVGDALREVWIPYETTDRFLRGAEENTLRNVETCAFICGQLMPRQNRFHVTHLLFPKQTRNTANYCEADVEYDVEFQEVCERLNLITLGWIHTHPTQSAFLSSVDLHNTFAYQMALAEAIAIVCAPAKDQKRVFHLTELGMNEVQNCRQEAGDFHHHDDDPPRFEDCKHVKWDDDMHLMDVVDLRGI